MWKIFQKPKGSIIVDEGAKKAIINGKNLLPAGIRNINGHFDQGEVVDIICNNKIFAKMITDFNADDLKTIKGKKSSEMQKILDKKVSNIAKRENLVFME